jgi:hypothetical protein
MRHRVDYTYRQKAELKQGIWEFDGGTEQKTGWRVNPGMVVAPGSLYIQARQKILGPYGGITI